MQLARVIGTVVATVKNDSLKGRKLLIIQSLNKNLAAQGKPMVAIDSVGAGVGELVLVRMEITAAKNRKRVSLSNVTTRLPIARSSELLIRKSTFLMLSALNLDSFINCSKARQARHEVQRTK